MKKLVIGLAAFVFGMLVSNGSVQAREGVVKLSGSEVSCEGVSLWKERNYRVMGRCDGLVYPYETQLEHYVIWAQIDESSEMVRVAEVDRGYFDGNVSKSFTNLTVSAEADGLPRRPSEKQVATGSVSGFSFAKSEGAVMEPVASATPNEEGGSMTVQGGTNEEASSGTTVGSVLGKILRSLLVIISVAIVLVVGTSLVFRRRGSVSG